MKDRTRKFYPVAEKTAPRFQLPLDDQLFSIAILFNGGKLEPEKIAEMVAMCRFVIDRVYENGDVTKPTLKEMDDDFQTLENKFKNGC